MTESMATNIAVASYERLAAEYYDPSQHPTCANFRQASQVLLERLTPDVPAERSCEVGAGDSLLADLLVRRGRDVAGLLITDAYDAMLEYSRRWEQRGAVLAVARAERLPVANQSILLVVASLADPYDEGSFWSEVARVLMPGGQCLMTTPSWTWAHSFRADGLPEDLAQFELRNGETLYVPSYVREPSDQRHLIERHGLHVVHEDSITLSAIAEPVSEKLRVLAADDPVVNGYVATTQ
jgi:ubiquinone/menaquinone biosynthesis C-methylase UbiE